MSSLAAHEATYLRSFQIHGKDNEGSTTGLLPSPATSIYVQNPASCRLTEDPYSTPRGNVILLERTDTLTAYTTQCLNTDKKQNKTES